MAFNQFTNLDFKNIRSQIQDYLRTNTNFTDFDFEGSNFSILIDLLAYNTYITAFNTNMAVNEAYIDSATLRENVVSLVRNIGYVPRSRRSARARVSFTVDYNDLPNNDPQIPLSITLKAGIVALGSVRSGNYIFSLPEDVTVPVKSKVATFSNIEVYEGSYVTKTFDVNTSSSYQKFILENIGIDSTTVRVRVINDIVEEYIQFANIFKVDSNTKLFLLQEVLDEKYQIIFGDGILGKKPETGSKVFVSYIISNGKSGNGCSNFTFSGILKDNNGADVTNRISLLSTNQASENGDDIEPIDSIKYLAPRVYASQYRAVTANDYKSLIPFLFPNIESVSAYGGEELSPPEYGKVFISAKPKNGSFISKADKDRILRQLKSYSIAGIKPELVDLKYLYIELSSNVYYDRSKVTDIDSLKSNIISTLINYSKSSDINVFGGRFKFSKVNALIDNVNHAVTSNITRIKIRRNLNPVLNTLANYELCYGNAFHVKKNNFSDGNGYNLKSTGFRISQSDDILYLSDTPISATQGSIFFFKLVDGLPVIVLRDIGTVDYAKGEIRLGPTIFTFIEGSEIQIEVSPESNDIIALREIYLRLEQENLNINMIEDTLSSGYNLSGNEYIVSSSYPNGLFIR